ncbi:class III lanthionine synthetase LanKC [Streptomyces chartreusis]|uniref:class III lanthionine synthetase LanKC n=1 Tax=Streptomyces chartreusis TaxID=1969 RepID=UPI003D8B7EE1
MTSMTDPQAALLYCAADPMYFETPERIQDNASLYELEPGELASGWRRGAKGLWVTIVPESAEHIEQGWKIHVSATKHTARTVLDRVAAICVLHEVSFKFLRSEDALLLMSSKHAPRSSSGKFIVAYPATESQLDGLLTDLVAAVDGLPGPGILTDLRIGSGPVHVRYGAFVDLRCLGDDGLPVPALRAPSGELVPDVRIPAFRLPKWVHLPHFLEPHLATQGKARDDDMPYLVREALHFSNAGGVYLAEHRVSGERVVLREARPFSGIDGAGSDGVERLHRECQILMSLQGLDCVPRVYGSRTVWEHHFLIEEYIEGQTLLDAIVNRYPLPGRDTSEEVLTAYASWVAAVTRKLACALDEIHARGVSFRDLHPGNIILRPNGSVVLVDFEYATALTGADVPPVGAMGFTAPLEADGLQTDQHGLWATWLSMLMPMVEVTHCDPSKAALLEAEAREHFRLKPADVPCRPVLGQTATDVPPLETGDPFGSETLDWATIRDQLVAGIRAGATVEREDRLFPGHWTVFDTGGHTLAHGAAGVLTALQRAGVEIPVEYVDWLVAAAQLPYAGIGRGLYDGLYGVAITLDELGRSEDALDVLSRARAADAPVLPGLFSGQAGIALSLCHFATRNADSSLLSNAVCIADRLDKILREGSQTSLRLPDSAGLMHGWSGVALLHLRLYRITGMRRHLAAARTALEQDLLQCVTMLDGTVQVKRGHRHLLYLDGGSGGIALAAREYLAHADHPGFSALLEAVQPGCATRFVREPGLFQGRAGLIAMLSLLAHPGQRDQVLASVRRLGWHAVRRGNGLLIPGLGLTRFSADLATGSAGVLLALHTVFDEKNDLATLIPGS